MTGYDDYGRGDDAIFGEGGDDRLHGGRGDDWLDGGDRRRHRSSAAPATTC